MKPIACFALTAQAFFANPDIAAANEWTRSPTGGNVLSVRYVPGHPGTAVAVTGGAIYRTTDHRVSWRPVSGELISDLVRIAVAPGNPNRVFVAGNAQFPKNRTEDLGA